MNDSFLNIYLHSQINYFIIQYKKISIILFVKNLTKIKLYKKLRF